MGDIQQAATNNLQFFMQSTLSSLSTLYNLLDHIQHFWSWPQTIFYIVPLLLKMATTLVFLSCTMFSRLFPIIFDTILHLIGPHYLRNIGKWNFILMSARWCILRSQGWVGHVNGRALKDADEHRDCDIQVYNSPRVATGVVTVLKKVNGMLAFVGWGQNRKAVMLRCNFTKHRLDCTWSIVWSSGCHTRGRMRRHKNLWMLGILTKTKCWPTEWADDVKDMITMGLLKRRFTRMLS